MKEISIKNIEILTDLAPALQQFKALVLPGKITYCGVKSLKSCIEQLKTYDESRMQVLNLFAKKGPDGKPVQKFEGGQAMFDFENDADKEDANKQIEEILKMDVSVKIYPVLMSDLKQVNISGELLERLIAREFIIDDL